MGERNEILLSIARQKADKLARHPDVEAIIVTGSLSRGRVDKASDVDMIVYYKGDIPEQIKQDEQEEVRVFGGNIRSSAQKVFIVNHIIQGVLCEVAHFQRDVMGNIIDKVVEEYDVEKNNHAVVTGTFNSLVLYDVGLIQNWKERLSNYPEELATKLVENHLQFPSKWVFQDMGISRNDFVFVSELMLKTQENIVGILCGLNKMYLPGKMKGLEHPIGLMKIKPQHLLERFMQIWKMETSVAVDEVIRLISDTWDLVDEHMPVVSTTEARRKFESLI